MTGDPTDGLHGCDININEDLWELDMKRNWFLVQGSTRGFASQKNYLYNLTNEILLMIIRHLCDDAASFFCVRQVSRRFRQITGDKEFRAQLFSTYHECDICDGALMSCKVFPIEAYYARISSHPEKYDLRRRIWAYLRSDRLCETCQRGDEEREMRMGFGMSCRFTTPALPKYLYCSGCRTNHPVTFFSAAQMGNERTERICIAREGHVRLCDHEIVTWADVESWTQQGTGYAEENQAMIKCCKHPSHIFGCTGNSWPFAKLEGRNPKGMVLSLSWRPHTGLMEFPSSDGDNGQIQISQMGAFIRKYRRNAARFVAPEAYPGHVPEAECFGAIQPTVDGGRTRSPNPAMQRIASPWRVRRVSHSTPEVRSAIDSLLHSEIQVALCGADPSAGRLGFRCLMMTYERNIYCGPLANGSERLVPDHSWYHAVERDSYDWSCHGASGARGTCVNKSCWNYYPRFGPCVGATRCKPRETSSIL